MTLRLLPFVDRELIKARMTRTLKGCADLDRRAARLACYASNPRISAQEIEAFDDDARLIESRRRLTEPNRLTFGERAAGLLFIPLGLPIVGIASIASDEAEAASSKGAAIVDLLDRGWGFLPLAIAGAGIVIGSVIAVMLAAKPRPRK